MATDGSDITRPLPIGDFASYRRNRMAAKDFERLRQRADAKAISVNEKRLARRRNTIKMQFGLKSLTVLSGLHRNDLNIVKILGQLMARQVRRQKKLDLASNVPEAKRPSQSERHLGVDGFARRERKNAELRHARSLPSATFS